MAQVRLSRADSAPHLGFVAVFAFAISACSGGVVVMKDAPPEPSPLNTAPLNTEKSLFGIWGTSATDLSVVGDGGAIFHRGVEGWSESTSGVESTLHDVFGTAADDVWAAGEGVVLHFDGDKWKTVLEDPDLSLLGVWSSGPKDAWVGGSSLMDSQGILEHWDGEKWSEGEIGATFWDVWGSGPNDVWLGGTAFGGGGLLMRYDGTIIDDARYSGSSLRGMWGTGSDVWVAPYDGSFQHWDGSAWDSLPAPPHGQLLDVAGTSAKDLWSVGLAGTVFHFDGKTWDDTSFETKEALMAAWAGEEDDLWVVGGNGTLRHWNGAVWAAE